MPQVSLSEWNDFIDQHPQAHLLQTGEWGELKSSFGWEAVRLISGEVGVQILFRRIPLGFTFAYVPKGPVGECASPADDERLWAEVDVLCRRRRAVFLKLERPGWEGEMPSSPPRLPFILSPQHIQPRNTLVIDLTGSEGEVFNRMKPKTRYNIRLAARKEIVVHPSGDLETFYRLISATSEREAFHVHSLEYYRRAYDLFHPKGRCELFLADFHEQALAAVMVFAYGQNAYYLYGASADIERNRKPTYPLQWEAIRWAKARGCVEYDMWGIPDDVQEEEEDTEREDGLWGVYRFKRGFGGSIRRAFPTLDRVYNPLLYKLYIWRFASSGTD